VKVRLFGRRPRSAAPQSRRVGGYHHNRLDGLCDLIPRAPGASVLDIGCNRGLVAFELVSAGASLVHGCDNYELGIQTAREIFADCDVRSRFEVVDLTEGSAALERAFGQDYQPRYDIVLFLAVYHKLRRIMDRAELAGLVHHLATRTGRYFAYRNLPEEIPEMESILHGAGLRRIHYSEISDALHPAGIWAPAARPPAPA
jgi:SAM-dependent methyltransferase